MIDSNDLGGWYRIAWAFLKLVDADWRSGRFGQRVRLQLFKPQLKVRIIIQ